MILHIFLICDLCLTLVNATDGNFLCSLLCFRAHVGVHSCNSSLKDLTILIGIVKYWHFGTRKTWESKTN